MVQRSQQQLLNGRSWFNSKAGQSDKYSPDFNRPSRTCVCTIGAPQLNPSYVMLCKPNKQLQIKYTYSNYRPIITSQYNRGKVMVIRFKLIYVLTERHCTVHRGTAFVAALNFQSSQRQLSPKYCITFPDFIFENFTHNIYYFLRRYNENITVITFVGISINTTRAVQYKATHCAESYFTSRRLHLDLTKPTLSLQQ